MTSRSTTSGQSPSGVRGPSSPTRRASRCTPPGRSSTGLRTDAASTRTGVNTGFGRFVSQSIPEELTQELQLRLLRSHACGVGEPYPDEIVRAAMLLRANALAKGRSGARAELVELLLECLDRRVLPVVPSRGSVGASGDLAPLAHLALPLVGEGEAWFDGERLPGRAALERAGLAPMALEAKEGLSLVNGTQFMTSFGSLGLTRAWRLARAADIACAVSLEALQGSRSSFISRDPRPAAVAWPDGSRGERALAARGLGDQRVAPLVRQGAGRVLAPVRAAGARRLTGPLRLRRLHGLRRAECGDRQPARARRGRPARLERELPRPAAGVRARRAGDGCGRAREHLGTAGRAARQPEPVGRTAAVPDHRRRAQLRVHDPAVRGRVTRQREQGARPPASVDSIPTSAGQEDHVSMGKRRRAEGVAGARERRVGARDRAARRRAGGSNSSHRSSRDAEWPRREASCATSRRGSSTTGRWAPTSTRSPGQSATGRSSRRSRTKSGRFSEHDRNARCDR